MRYETFSKYAVTLGRVKVQLQVNISVAPGYDTELVIHDFLDMSKGLVVICCERVRRTLFVAQELETA